MLKKVVRKRLPEHDITGIAGGIFFGGLIFIMSLLGKFFGLFSEALNILMAVYAGLGYDITYFGIILGTVYGFVTGFILFYLYSWIHGWVGIK